MWPGMDPLAATLGEQRAELRGIHIRLDRQEDTLLEHGEHLAVIRAHIERTPPPPRAPSLLVGTAVVKLAALATMGVLALAGIIQPAEVRDAAKAMIGLK
jgi:hypothetical protein